MAEKEAVDVTESKDVDKEEVLQPQYVEVLPDDPPAMSPMAAPMALRVTQMQILQPEIAPQIGGPDTPEKKQGIGITDYETKQDQSENAQTDADKLKSGQNVTMASISDTKDKTQVTAATSMSVIHIGILKAILDLGPQGMSYYYWSLGFVIAALALQFLAGLIAIYIATMKTYLSKHHGDFTEACMEKCCPCIARDDDSDDYDFEDYHRRKHDEKTSLVPKNKGTKKKANYYQKVCHDYEKWTENCHRKQMDAANAVTEIAWLKTDIANLNARRTTLFKETNENANDDRIRDIDQRLSKKEQELEKYVEKRRDWIRYLERGIILETHVDSIFQDRVLRSASFWQLILTVLVFLVFALNAIITGFGLANMSGNFSGKHNSTK